MPRTLASVASLIAVCAATPAAAQTWTSAPTAAEMAAAYPAKAKAEGVGGDVLLACTASRGGAMTACDVLTESPRGYGFGGAARKLAQQSLRAQGLAKDAEVRVPIAFSADLAKGGAVTVKTPKWAALPSVTDMQSAVPKTEGGPNNIRVTLVCDVQAGGSLNACAVDREEPAGQGFGPAILALAPKFKVELMSAEGMPTVGAKVRVPVRFDLKPVQQATK
ncbi:MAG: energy transducer TonB [Alphaproteobacteria bacterium]|nr:energy transducer TonB [Alphaproteobacteria bacterium]MBU1512793.1 energy transducer TonB [Alphaproteobacteria bacterium]MBU2093969.1 energy transducer TonB [Alphaproteobacteria bacterium]MBU2150003.1 energy transducer TonB [Alphaproteobacteria bacterium]MBU2306456.1 energy transducer TonB [Alphaproteobacteria bacterium]